MNTLTKPFASNCFVKVPEVTLAFWIVKIAATTLGETGGDAVSMSMHLGYLISTIIFAAIFIVAVLAQIRARQFHPFIYWATIIASTTVGTTLADFADRSLGIGYAGGAIVFSGMLMLVVALYYWTDVSRTLLFWAGFILTRPLGAVVGDFLDKPIRSGGLELSRYSASAALLVFILISILLFKQRAARTAH